MTGRVQGSTYYLPAHQTYQTHQTYRPVLFQGSGAGAAAPCTLNAERGTTSTYEAIPTASMAPTTKNPGTYEPLRAMRYPVRTGAMTPPMFPTKFCTPVQSATSS